jgi:hypothetical protein
MRVFLRLESADQAFWPPPALVCRFCAPLDRSVICASLQQCARQPRSNQCAPPCRNRATGEPGSAPPALNSFKGPEDLCCAATAALQPPLPANHPASALPARPCRGQHPLARVPSLPGQYSHEVHLQQRKLEVVDKPNGLSNWSSGDYSASLTAAAEGRQARFDQAASALPPFAADSAAQMAADAAASVAVAAARPNSGRGQHYQGDGELSTGKVGPQQSMPADLPHSPPSNPGRDQHSLLPPACLHCLALPPPLQVGGNGFGAEAYSGALQAAAAAKQQRFNAAATAGAPFAVAAGEGGMAGVASGSAYHYQRPGQPDPSSKVCVCGCWAGCALLGSRIVSPAPGLLLACLPACWRCVGGHPPGGPVEPPAPASDLACRWARGSMTKGSARSSAACGPQLRTPAGSATGARWACWARATLIVEGADWQAGKLRYL